MSSSMYSAPSSPSAETVCIDGLLLDLGETTKMGEFRCAPPNLRMLSQKRVAWTSSLPASAMRAKSIIPEIPKMQDAILSAPRSWRAGGKDGGSQASQQRRELPSPPSVDIVELAGQRLDAGVAF